MIIRNCAIPHTLYNFWLVASASPTHGHIINLWKAALNTSDKDCTMSVHGNHGSDFRELTLLRKCLIVIMMIGAQLLIHATVCGEG